MQLSKKIRQMKIVINREKGKAASTIEKLTTATNEIKQLRDTKDKFKDHAKSNQLQDRTADTIPASSKKIEELRMKLNKANSRIKQLERILSKEVNIKVA